MFGVVEEEFCEFGRGVGEEGAVLRGGNFGVGGESFAVDDHKLRAMVGRGEMEHANAGGVFGKGEMVLSQKPCDGCAIGTRIVLKVGVVIEKTFCVVDEGQTAEVRDARKFVVVGVFGVGRTVFELDPVKAFHLLIGAGFNEEMLLGDGADFGWAGVELDDLGTDVAELLGEGEVGSGEFGGDEGLILDVALDGRERRGLREYEGG